MFIRNLILSALLAGSLSGCIYYVQQPASPVADNYVAAPPAPVQPPPPAPVVEYQPPPPQVALVYQDDLSPYGRWIIDPHYGRCWIPYSVPYGWQPYTVGHWVYTDDGSCFWVAEGPDAPWGGIVYHYGNWVLSEGTGWLWVPGTVWAPAWVAWREGDGYCGWTPLPPEACQGDITVVVVDRYCPPDRYVYCNEHEFNDTRIDQHIVRNNVTIINNTTNITNVTIVNNQVVNRGVPAESIHRATGLDVQRLHIAQTSDRQEALRQRQQGLPVRYTNPAIERVQTQVAAAQANQARLLTERAQKATAEQQRRQAADDQKVQAANEARQQKDVDHQKQVEADQAAKRAAADQRQRDLEAQRKAQHDAQVERQQQAAAAREAAQEAEQQRQANQPAPGGKAPKVKPKPQDAPPQ